MRKLGPALLGIVFAAMVVIALLTYPLSSSAAPSASPVKALAERDVYYPGSEDLAPDEMRVVARAGGAGNRLHGVQRDQGRDSYANGGYR